MWRYRPVEPFSPVTSTVVPAAPASSFRLNLLDLGNLQNNVRGRSLEVRHLDLDVIFSRRQRIYGVLTRPAGSGRYRPTGTRVGYRNGRVRDDGAAGIGDGSDPDGLYLS